MKIHSLPPSHLCNRGRQLDNIKPELEYKPRLQVAFLGHNNGNHLEIPGCYLKHVQRVGISQILEIRG